MVEYQDIIWITYILPNYYPRYYRSNIDGKINITKYIIFDYISYNLAFNILKQW